MGSQNEMMIWTTDLIDQVTTHSRGAKVKWGVGGREPHGFPGNLQEAHPIWEETVWMDRVNKAHGIQTRWGFLGKAANWGGPEEVLG